MHLNQVNSQRSRSKNGKLKGTYAAGRASLDRLSCDDVGSAGFEVPECVIPLCADGLAAKPNPKPRELLLGDPASKLLLGTDAAVDAVDSVLPAPVSEPVPKLKPVDPGSKPVDPETMPMDAEPKPVNPLKPLNAPVCTVHRTLTCTELLL